MSDEKGVAAGRASRASLSEEGGAAAGRKRDRERRAKALRANLTRRKAQALARKAPQGGGPDGGGGAK
jgi:hypothetical protein